MGNIWSTYPCIDGRNLTTAEVVCGELPPPYYALIIK